MSNRPSRIVSIAALTVIILLAPPLFRIAIEGDVLARDWRSANLTPAGFALAPGACAPAVVQAYAASVVGWRGVVADHCWIAVKAAGTNHYRRYEVIGYRLGRTGSALVESDTAAPDQKWYGSQPRLLQDIRSADAEKIIAAPPAAVASYSYAKTYCMWPGPTSNTFIAHVAREIPALRLAQPGTAIEGLHRAQRFDVGAQPRGVQKLFWRLIWRNVGGQGRPRSQPSWPCGRREPDGSRDHAPRDRAHSKSLELDAWERR